MMGARNVFAEAIALLVKHQWTPHDESNDYCVECGGSKPEPYDTISMGHVKGCALASVLRAAGIRGIIESGQSECKADP